jgi:hypothetical protein
VVSMYAPDQFHVTQEGLNRQWQIIVISSNFVLEIDAYCSF